MVDVYSKTDVNALLAKKAGQPSSSGTNGQVLTRDSAAPNGTSWVTPSASSGGTTVSDATSSGKGIVQLAGDLAGSASAPTLKQLHANARTVGSSTSSARITFDVNGRITSAEEVAISVAGSGSSSSGGVTAKVDGASVQTLDITTSVSASDVGALPLPSGTPAAGQVPVVTNVTPLALGWGSGGSGGGSGASFFGSIIRPETFGAKADGIVLTDLVVNQGSTTVSSASAPFTNNANDAGKVIYWRDGSNWNKGVIQSVSSTTQATLQTAASTGIQTDGGPNPNAYFGTDCTNALNSTYTAAQAASAAKNDFGKAVTMGKEVRLAGGVYITKPLIRMNGWNVRTVGEGMDQTAIVCSEPGVIYELNTYNSETSQAFVGGTLNWGWFDLQLWNPLQYNSEPSSKSTSTRIVTGVRDNGGGSVTMERVRMKGLKFGFCGAYGSDFDRFSHIYNTLCDVGIYLGIGAQQIELNNIDGSDCKEVVVLEGCQNWHIGGNSHFQDPKISAITIEGKPSGQRTRSGVRNDINDGGWYSGNMVIDGAPWFETNSGNNGSICPRMIWVNGDGPFGPAFNGLVIRDALLIAGGQQVPGGSNCFIEFNSGQVHDQPVVLDGLSVGGSFINYIFNSSGVANTKPLLKNMSYDTSKIAMVRNTNAHRYILQNGQYHGFTAV